jgi:LmbE family N-acetylglucosaminyl deacetylase
VIRQALQTARRLEATIATARDRRVSSGLVPDPEAPILLLSPHLDDAVFNCWSVLTSHADVRVVNVFTELPPAGSCTLWDQICGGLDSQTHMEERIREDSEALALAGRVGTNLPFLDSQYRRRRPTLRQLDDALGRVLGGAAAVYAPAGLGFDPHPDHVLVRRLALAAARQGVQAWFYADVPYAVAFGWPHWVDGSQPDERLDIDAFWRRLGRDVPTIGNVRDARVVRLEEGDAKLKLAAMATYGTQFTAIDGGSVGLLRNPLIHGFEVFWAARDT